MNEKQTTHWSRQEVASKLAELEAYVCLNPETTQSQLARELGIPRTTLQHWIKRKEEIDADPQIRDFFCSPTGLAFLHRLVIGAQFTLVMLSGGSPRKVAQFLELTGLDRFPPRGGAAHCRFFLWYTAGGITSNGECYYSFRKTRASTFGHWHEEKEDPRLSR